MRDENKADVAEASSDASTPKTLVVAADRAAATNRSDSHEGVSASPEGEPTAEEAPKPRRRGRKPKAAASDSEPAAAASGTAPASLNAESAPAPAPKRARKPRAKKSEQVEGPQAEAELSPETLQARALAKISQASVERRQRRVEKRAAEVIAGSADEARSDAAGARAVATADALAAAQAPVAIPAIPLVDPALRPHSRGRKPKAYVEAERAAAAALEAAQRAALEAAMGAAQASESEPAREAEGRAAGNDGGDGEQQREKPAAKRRRSASERRQQRDAAEDRRDDADARVEDGRADVERAASDAGQQALDGRDSKQDRASSDVRPGRARRTAKEKRAAEQGRAEQSQQTEDAAAGAKEAAVAEGKPKRQHTDRRRDRQHGDERSEQRQGGGDRGDKRGNRQQNNRKNRNNRLNAPPEPTLSREELAGYKVAELREKAKELEIDYAGMKKAELVEEVYTAAARAEGFRDIEGILDIAREGFGYIRAHGYMPSREDAFVPANMIRGMGLRAGDMICATLRPSRANDKFPGVAKVTSINGGDPESMKRRPKFADLTPIYPNESLKMEHGRDSITGRAIDIVSPIGKGQRGLIVSPPKAGKTTILKKICQSIATNNPEVHLICLLVDERPEEVTDMQRSIKGDVVASTFDMPADNHTRVSELVIERAKRLVEMGGDVVVVLDSITRLARAYNLAAPASGRILSGGVDSAALYPPKRFLGAARNIENGGSLTILASALVDTGSKMDEVIFEEFKGTGNMELKLDRDLADRRVFPAIDPIQSGTRNEELLIDQSMQPFVWGIRRILAGMNNTERAAAAFIKGLKGTDSNQEFLIRSAKKAADHPDAL